MTKPSAGPRGPLVGGQSVLPRRQRARDANAPAPPRLVEHHEVEDRGVGEARRPRRRRRDVGLRDAEDVIGAAERKRDRRAEHDLVERVVDAVEVRRIPVVELERHQRRRGVGGLRGQILDAGRLLGKDGSRGADRACGHHQRAAASVSATLTANGRRELKSFLLGPNSGDAARKRLLRCGSHSAVADAGPRPGLVPSGTSNAAGYVVTWTAPIWLVTDPAPDAYRRARRGTGGETARPVPSSRARQGDAGQPGGLGRAPAA